MGGRSGWAHRRGGCVSGWEVGISHCMVTKCKLELGGRVGGRSGSISAGSLSANWVRSPISPTTHTHE